MLRNTHPTGFRFDPVLMLCKEYDIKEESCKTDVAVALTGLEEKKYIMRGAYAVNCC